jgi:hypothetical protein
LNSNGEGGWHPSSRSVARWTVIAGIFTVLGVTYALVHDWRSPATSSTTTTASAPPTTDSIPPVTDSSTSDSPTPASPVGEAAATYLNDLEPLGGEDFTNETGAFDIDGQTYAYARNFATSGADPTILEYSLGNRYSTFSVVLGNRDDAPETQGTSSCHWRILADGRELASGNTTRGHHIKIKSKDIRGVVHLRFEATQIKGIDNPVPWPCTTGDAQVS